jgi:hypothetical protein
MTIEHGYRSPRLLSRFAIAGVVVIGLCALAAGLIGVAQVIDPNRVINLADEDTSLWYLLQGLIAIFQIPAYVFSVTMFLIWLYRVYTNLPPLRSDNNEFTPGWAVGWWFIPIANMIKPFQAVRNAWAESDPYVDQEAGFLSGVQSGAPGYMALWWAAWIIANIVNNVLSRFFDPDDMRNVAIVGYAFIFSGIMWVIAAALAVKVIVDITSRQDERYRRLGSVGHQEPPPPPSFGPLAA